MIDWPPYSFLEKAAAEARAESRRHWAKDGEADRRWPKNPSPGWRIPYVDDPQAKRDAAVKRHKGAKR
jgi:hypothetical protein